MIESTLTFNNHLYRVDHNHPYDLSITLNPKSENPNCYYTDPPVLETIRAHGFVGSVSEGGPCNHRRITLAPHGNGTHTECYGHCVEDEEATLNRCLKEFWYVAQVITIDPTTRGMDQVIEESQVTPHLIEGVEALILRTLPNNPQKQTRNYSGTNPPYLSAALTKALAQAGISQLLVDLPSVDREEDDGQLSAHKAFWGLDQGEVRRNNTITELIYVPASVPDELYLLNLQVMNLANDAAPSRPIVYPLIS
jgi:kynurenine formamidase